MSDDKKPNQFVIQKSRITVSLPEHIGNAIGQRARPMSATPTEYATGIIRWWFGKGCPPITTEEEVLRWVNSKGADLKLSKKPDLENRATLDDDDLSRVAIEIYRELKAKGYNQDKDGNWIKPKSSNQTATKR